MRLPGALSGQGGGRSSGGRWSSEVARHRSRTAASAAAMSSGPRMVRSAATIIETTTAAYRPSRWLRRRGLERRGLADLAGRVDEGNTPGVRRGRAPAGRGARRGACSGPPRCMEQAMLNQRGTRATYMLRCPASIHRGGAPGLDLHWPSRRQSGQGHRPRRWCTGAPHRPPPDRREEVCSRGGTCRQGPASVRGASQRPSSEQ